MTAQLACIVGIWQLPKFRHSTREVMEISPPPVDTLFRRFSIEMFVVGLRVGASMVDDAVTTI